MYEFFNDYVKPKYVEKAKFRYMDIESFFVYIKTENIYKDPSQDAETRFDTTNYELDRPLPNVKNKKVIGLRKDELGGEVVRLRAKNL